MNILLPQTESELLLRAIQLTGKTLGQLANQANESVPLILHRSKGWIGQLIEKHLGANAGQLAQPDFIHLGIELKTLPVNANGLPRESTYICTAPIPPQDFYWETSRVWKKIAKILWIPIQSSAHIPLEERRVGYPILWSPDDEEERQLRQDWEELTERMLLGHFDTLSAHYGHYLQIRPKAANAKTLIQVIDQQGDMTAVVPKGFYMRTTLTKQILQNYYTK